jgi:hypothetical protein
MLPAISDFLTKKGFSNGTRVEARDISAKNRLIAFLNSLPSTVAVRVVGLPSPNPCQIIALPLIAGRTDDDLLRLLEKGEIHPRSLRRLVDEPTLNFTLHRAYDPMMRMPHFVDRKYVHHICGTEFSSYDEANSHVQKGGCKPSLDFKRRMKAKVRQTSANESSCGLCGGELSNSISWYVMPGYGKFRICAACSTKGDNDGKTE